MSIKSKKTLVSTEIRNRNLWRDSLLLINITVDEDEALSVPMVSSAVDDEDVIYQSDRYKGVYFAEKPGEKMIFW